MFAVDVHDARCSKQPAYAVQCQQLVILAAYHVYMLIPVEPLARQPCIESQEWEGAKDILIKLQVVTVNMMRHLQHSMALRLVMVSNSSCDSHCCA